MAYLQFDGVTNASNSHRHISNLFDAKLLAIENLWKAGITVTLVTTVVNTVNEKGVGPLLEFVIQNSDKLGGISLHPVSFTGRDDDISGGDRRRQRYTISHLAHEFARYFEGRIDPYRDWFPLGMAGAFASLADHLRGPDVQFGGLSCSCHPNCGSAVMMVVNDRTKAWAPLSAFFDLDRFMEDIRVIVDTGRGRALSLTQIGLSFLRNYDQSKAPAGLTIEKLLRLVNRRMGGAFTHGEQPPQEEWKLLWIGGMWFQDLWTYDFRRTEMCVIPYATQEGEISFCAYNTGVGWRQIVENMHMVATTKDWFADKGRHQIYAGDRPMPLPKSLKRQLPVVETVGAGESKGGCGTGCGCSH